MKDKIVFLPVKEEFMPFPHQIFYAEFHLRFVEITITMFDVDKFRADLVMKGIKATEEIKKYALMLAVGPYTWLFYTDDDYEKSKAHYMHCINGLKEGKTYEFEDILGHQKNKPIRISWQMIRFEW